MESHVRPRLRVLSFTATLVVTLAVAVAVAVAAPAQAAQPPAGYPTSQVMANVSNPAYGSIPIRRGFYDADANKGFGMDKAWHKHNITSLNAQKILMGSPNGTTQGNGNVDLRTYVGYYKCSGNVCTLQTQILVHGIYAPNNATYISGWPVGGKVGLLTAYCANDSNATDCPNWVTYSMDHPGQSNPYYPNGVNTQSASSAGSEPAVAPAEPTGVFNYSYTPLAESISK